MSKLTIAKFGGSAIGIDGEGIPQIIKRIKEIEKNGKLVVVCSAPLTMVDGKKKSLTDVVLGIGDNVVNGNSFDFSIVEKSKPFPFTALLPIPNTTSVSDFFLPSTIVSGAEQTTTSLPFFWISLILLMIWGIPSPSIPIALPPNFAIVSLFIVYLQMIGVLIIFLL